ncbi:MAG: hypothetical protein AAF742_04460 [Pseudomonadota bacterium]
MGRLGIFGKKEQAKAKGDPLEALVLKERLRVLKNTDMSETGPISGTPRGSKRERSHKVGEIRLEDGKTISCLVHDFSDSGMRLEITEDGMEAPEQFRLRVPTLQFDRDVIVKWSAGAELGVTYLD